MPNQLPPSITEFINGVNAFDTARIMATFADDALVNDNHREFWGKAEIEEWIAAEMVGDHVTIVVTETLEHRGRPVVRGRYDGDYANRFAR
jgi:ketosteroid isomerase-like protein